MSETAKPSVIYVVSEDWYFLSHRLPMARAAKRAGFDVHVATHVSDGGQAIRNEGFTLHHLKLRRGRIAPWQTAIAIRSLRTLYRNVRPAIVHHVALQCVVIGSLAAKGLPVACVNALTGLGYTFTSYTARAKLIQPIVSAMLRWLLNREHGIALVQNRDDEESLVSLGVDRGHVALIPGSGIDADEFKPAPEPEGPITIGFAGRLLDDKGIRTLVEAFRLLQARGWQFNLLIAGERDPANPASVTQREVELWATEAGVEVLGQIKRIETLWQRAHIAVLPSRREGLPKTLLEAAACGRPMVATDVPGCREIVVPDETGLLVPPDDPTALAEAISKMAASATLRARFGTAARKRVIEKFSADAIGAQIVDLYRRLERNA